MKSVFLAIAVALSLISFAQVQTTNVSLLNNTYVDRRNNANGDFDVNNGVRVTKQSLVLSQDPSRAKCTARTNPIISAKAMTTP